MNNTELILINIGHSTHNADWNWKEVCSPFFRIFYVTEGTAKLIFQDHETIATPGNVYLIPPFSRHSYRCEGYYSHIYIHFYEKPSSKTVIFDQYSFPTRMASNNLKKTLIERLLSINPGCGLTQYDPKFYDNQHTLIRNIARRNHIEEHIILETRGILMQLMAGFMSAAAKKHECVDFRINKSISYIRRNIDRQICVNELSDQCHLSNDHFIRLFKKEIGMTPVIYINRKKIEKAQLLLTVSDDSIKDVALGLGFDNISYFNKLFKSITQTTPTQYIIKNNLRQI